MEFVTQAEFARLRGVDPSTVTLWKKSGLLVLSPRGRIDVAASEALIDARPEVRKGGRANRRPTETGSSAELAPAVAAALDAILPAAAEWSLHEASRRKEIALALTRQLEYDLKAANAVEIASVVDTVQEQYGVLRDRLLQLPGKLADRVTGLIDRHEVESILRAEVFEALSALSSQPVPV